MKLFSRKIQKVRKGKNPERPSFNFTLPAASTISLATAVVGVIVGFVPSWAPLKEALIVGVAFGLSAVFMVVNSQHAKAASHVIAARTAAGVIPVAANVTPPPSVPVVPPPSPPGV